MSVFVRVCVGGEGGRAFVSMCFGVKKWIFKRKEMCSIILSFAVPRGVLKNSVKVCVSERECVQVCVCGKKAATSLGWISS